MTFKEFKNVIDAISTTANENARVYVEQQIGENTYLQTEAISMRHEENDLSSYFIIEGFSGDQV